MWPLAAIYQQCLHCMGKSRVCWSSVLTGSRAAWVSSQGGESKQYCLQDFNLSSVWVCWSSVLTGSREQTFNSNLSSVASILLHPQAHANVGNSLKSTNREMYCETKQQIAVFPVWKCWNCTKDQKFPNIETSVFFSWMRLSSVASGFCCETPGRSSDSQLSSNIGEANPCNYNRYCGNW